MNWFVMQGFAGADFRGACSNHDACLMSAQECDYHGDYPPDMLENDASDCAYHNAHQGTILASICETLHDGLSTCVTIWHGDFVASRTHDRGLHSCHSLTCGTYNCKT